MILRGSTQREGEGSPLRPRVHAEHTQSSSNVFQQRRQRPTRPPRPTADAHVLPTVMVSMFPSPEILPVQACTFCPPA